ncbi:MAG: response regulator transcription factor [Pseudomonadota bacterium]
MSENNLQGISVFLVDDHPAVTEGLTILLSRYGIVVRGQAGSREKALRALATVVPDLVLVDLSLGSDNGLDLIADLKSAGMKTLVYTMHDDAWHIRSALAAGANGYVTKREITDTLPDAIGAILAGQRFLSPGAAEALAAGDPAAEKQIAWDRLSAREREIFRGAGEGLSTVDIADELQISVSTVETNIARIISKLGLSGTKEMRRRAIQHLRNIKPGP